MGGAVSSGRDNNELIDNLKNSNYIRSRDVELVFRALDRADYMLAHERDRAYKDLAWRSGALHMSAPCIYSEVMEGLELKPGLTFLNVGSGTGYLSTLVGLIIGAGGISHGVEVHGMVVDYATKRLKEFLENSATLDEFDFCEPKFYHGNGLCLAPLQAPYDRVYCGAGCPEEYQSYFKQLIKVGGVLVMPLNDNLVQVRRTGVAEWTSRNVLQVSFASLRVPTAQEATEHIKLEEQSPARLQALSRASIRAAMRVSILSYNPQLRAPEPRETARKACPRRICIPIDDDSDVEGLNALHDLDRATGATEMNALLSLVLSMGQNRVAGALRFDPIDSSSTVSSDEDGHAGDDNDDAGDDDPGAGGGNDAPPPPRDRRFPFDASDRVNIETFENLEDMNRAIHRAMNRPTGSGEGGEPTTRGRLSVTLEYNTRAGAGAAPGAEEADAPAPDEVNADVRQSVNRTINEFLCTGHGECSYSTEPTSSGDKQDNPAHSSEETNKEEYDVPSEVEIDLQTEKQRTRVHDGITPSDEMEVDAENSEHAGRTTPTNRTPPKDRAPRAGESPAADRTSLSLEQSSSEEQSTEPSSSKCKTGKRQKLDSGIGEENSPSSDTSPSKLEESRTDSECDPRDADQSAGDLDDINLNARRRLPKRSRRSRRSSRSASASSSDAEARGGGGGSGGAVDPRRYKRSRAAAAASPSRDARRQRLSLMMKRAVKELPLPYALQKYVNYQRSLPF